MFLTLSSHFCSVQAALEEPSASEGAAQVPILDKVSSPVKSMEKESVATAGDVVQLAQEEEPVLAKAVPEGTGNVVASDDQASRPALLLAPVVKAPTHGGASSSVLEGREGVSFPELYAGAIAQFDQQQVFLAKMKQEYEVFLQLLV